MKGRNVFITGGTGYLGCPLIGCLVARCHKITALVRQTSVGKVPAGVKVVVGNALDASTFSTFVPPADTFVHLVGVRRPGPFKGQAFRTIDLVSIQASVEAARDAGVKHFVYFECSAASTGHAGLPKSEAGRGSHD